MNLTSDDRYFSRLLIAFSPEIGIGRVMLVSVSLEKERVTQTRKKRDPHSRSRSFIFDLETAAH